MTESATALLAALRAGDLTPEGLMARTLDRIDAVNPGLNAIISLRDRDTLLAEARGADLQRPLGGLPIAIKDLVATAGLRTTQGSPLFADHVPETDDRTARVLKAAGAIVIGKTNTPEFGLGSNTFNPVFGATRNPYDLSRICGGSSGGAAVAVAAGMLPVVDGSDMMGSLRNPAAWANIYGLRPTAGLVAKDEPTMTIPLSTDGPMARHPEDLALLLDVLGAHETGWPHHVRLARGPVAIAGLRIGWLGDGGGLPFEPGLLDLCRDALDEMARAGAQVRDMAPPYDRDAIWDSWTTLRSLAIAANHGTDYEAPERRARLKETAIWEIERARHVSEPRRLAAEAARAEAFAALDRALGEVDLLALPTTQVWPFPHDLEYPSEIAGQKMDTYHRWMEVMIPASLAGLPALSIPVGFGSNGLPAGMQLIARRGHDRSLIAIAEAWDKLTGWPARRPPQLS